MSSAVFTPEERIRELSAINAEVAEMMKQAGLAVNALTNRPLANDDEDQEMTNGQHTEIPSEHKNAFKQHTAAFYTGVQAVAAKLKRNVYGLEEAGIISAEASDAGDNEPPRLGAGRQLGKPVKEEASRITNGGMGNLDVGWLNSRGNKVGAEKENELMQEARELLEGEVRRQEGAEGT